jgi:AraC-like DNA-binding protein
MRLVRISHARPLACGCDYSIALRTRHNPGEVLDRHRHEESFAAIVLSGAYVEAGDSGRHRVGPADVVFHSPFESHLDRFETSRAEVLNLPLPAGWIGPVLGTIDNPDAIVRIAERDVGEAVAALVAGVMERAPEPEDWPDLLAADLLHNPQVSLTEWSDRMRLHPGSLSRGFRQQFKVSPAEFRSIARARKAMRHLAELPLSELAFHSGFADQAHMSRAIKSLTGFSPRRLREYLAADNRTASLTLRAVSA